MTNYSLLKILFVFTLLFFCSSYSTIEKNNIELEDDSNISVIIICEFYKNSSLGTSCINETWKLTYNNNTCMGEMGGRMFATNLCTGTPVVGATYSLPNSVEDVYFEVLDQTNGNIDTYGPYSDFVYQGDSILGMNGQVFHLFEFDYTFELEVEPGCGFGNAYVNIPVTVEVKNAMGQTYDFNMYGASNDIFSCEVFAETCSSCYSICNSELPIYHGMACGKCGQCGPSEYVDNQETILINVDALEKSNVEEISSTLDVEIIPNPFSENFTIKNNQSSSSNLQIEIYDLEGKNVYQSVFTFTERKLDLEIDTSSLKTGVYICKITSDKETITRKLIKL